MKRSIVASIVSWSTLTPSSNQNGYFDASMRQSRQEWLIFNVFRFAKHILLLSLRLAKLVFGRFDIEIRRSFDRFYALGLLLRLSHRITNSPTGNSTP